MEQDEKQTGRKRRQHLRVPVFPDEKEEIERQARQAGLSVARYLREVGQGYEIKGITDYERVRELARINGDLGRLGGLLKLWLTDDVRTAKFGEATILALLGRIEATQDEMGRVANAVVRPQAVAHQERR
ncbi:MAG: conjugal transfer transcriptional regulator TraJ [Gammaproteobacteria bacterium]|nr:conjugal transfer transcriptional regulator TraJ [Gammaproteobacteria bacterium]